MACQEHASLERQKTNLSIIGKAASFAHAREEKTPAKANDAFEATLLADPKDTRTKTRFEFLAEVSESNFARGTDAKLPMASEKSKEPATMTELAALEDKARSRRRSRMKKAHSDASATCSDPSKDEKTAGRFLHRYLSAPEGMGRHGGLAGMSQDGAESLFMPTKIEIEAQERHERNMRRRAERLNRMHDLKDLLLDD